MPFYKNSFILYGESSIISHVFDGFSSLYYLIKNYLIFQFIDFFIL
nr:MAG TPA: hypothetical protein [Caudoviricetes sp.]